MCSINRHVFGLDFLIFLSAASKKGDQICAYHLFKEVFRTSNREIKVIGNNVIVNNLKLCYFSDIFHALEEKNMGNCIVMPNRFYGRERELELLRRLQNDVLEKGMSRFVAIAGRRRSGKTRLIEEALCESPETPQIFLYIASQLTQSNLSNLRKETADALGVSLPPSVQTYKEIFRFIFKESEKRPIALILDEFQNFEAADPTVFASLQELWDHYHTRSKLLLITCGSSVNSMQKIFEDRKAPLFAHVSAFIRLEPFDPTLLKVIFRDYKENFSGDDLLALYALTGGVAQYVQSMLTSGATTLDAMINHALLFSSGFTTEAQLMIASEFKANAANMNEILMAISQGKNRRTELASLFDFNISGHLNQLENLYGLIERTEPVAENGAKRKRIRYELGDALLDFWYTFCMPNLKMLQSPNPSAIVKEIEARYPTWAGRVLERLYRRHFRNLGLFTAVGPWWDKKGENEIDLVALNSTEKRIVFAEVKLNPAKIHLEELKKKASVFFFYNPRFATFECSFMGLSTKELASSEPLPFE